MSISIMCEIWENLETSAADTLLLLSLADSANDSGVICSVNLEKLAKRCRQSVEDLVKSLDRLQTEGWIFVAKDLFEDAEFICLNARKIFNRGGRP